MQILLRELRSLAIGASLACHAIAQNDECIGAIGVTAGLNGPFTNVGATTSNPAWPCGAATNDVWFVYVAPASGTLIAETCGTPTNFDTVIELFDGAAGCGALVSLGCDHNSCGMLSRITHTVSVGVTYFLRVGGHATFGFGTGTFSLSIIGPDNVVATNTDLGAGCIRKHTSFYEYFGIFGTSATIDLAGTAMTLVPNGLGGYLVTNVGSLLPVGSFATPMQLPLLDDSEVTRPFTVGSFPGSTGLTICSNGFVSLAAGNGTGYSPMAHGMLVAAQTGFYSWHDFNPQIPNSGKVLYEESSIATVITWDGVWDYGGTSTADANTVQFQFYSSGVVTMAWGAMSGLGNDHLVGYSPGGPSTNPGTIDLSSVLASTFQLEANDVVPLTLFGLTRPILQTPWNLHTANVPTNGTIGVDVFGLSDPGIDDLSFLGAPTCGLRASLDVMNAWLVAGSSHAYSLAIPNHTALLGLQVYTTNAVLQNPPQNAYGAITSNGVVGLIGNL